MTSVRHRLWQASVQFRRKQFQAVLHVGCAVLFRDACRGLQVQAGSLRKASLLKDAHSPVLVS